MLSFMHSKLIPILKVVFPIYKSTLITIAFQVIFFLQFHQRNITVFHFDFIGMMFVLTTFITIIWSFGIINGLLSFNRFCRASCNIVLILIYLLFWVIHIRTRHPFNFSVMSENAGEIFYKESMSLIFSSFGWQTSIGVVAIISLFAILEWKKQVFSAKRKTNYVFMTLIISISGYLFCLFYKVKTYDEVAMFIQTGIDYYTIDYNFDKGLLENKFPYLKKVVPKKDNYKDISAGAVSPDIFIVLVESFNKNFIEKKTKEGKELTPVINDLITKSIYVDNFYGNSVQTARGHVASLCGVLPSIRRKIFTHFASLNLNCLPAILKKMGYHTVLFNASRTNSYDSAAQFWQQNGFDEIKAMNEEFVKPSEAHKFWGWGIREDLFYIKAMEYFDKIKRSKSKPIFGFLITQLTHRDFDHVPKNFRYIHPNPINQKQHYENSIHVMDKFLGVFLGEIDKRKHFNNHILVISGDHGYPMGEHQNNHNEIGFYEENFKIPFIIRWPQKLATKRMNRLRYSQIDIPPTLLNLIQAGADTHFIGHDIFKNKNSFPTYLIQPYDGVYLAVIDNNLKYVKHVQTSREFLFNLKSDPAENHNIIDEFAINELSHYRKLIDNIYLNQYIIEKNLIWPKIDAKKKTLSRNVKF